MYMSYNSFTNEVTITMETPIKAVRFDRNKSTTEINTLRVKDNEAKFYINTPNPKKWSVHFSVEDQCKVWTSFMETSAP